MTILIVVAIFIHALGVVKAIHLLRNTVRVEELAKEAGIDYSIRNKKLMYVVCVLFSWLAFWALKDLQ